MIILIYLKNIKSLKNFYLKNNNICIYMCIITNTNFYDNNGNIMTPFLY